MDLSRRFNVEKGEVTPATEAVPRTTTFGTVSKNYTLPNVLYVAARWKSKGELL